MKMYTVTPGILCRDGILLNTLTDKAYTLNPTSAVIWQLLEKEYDCEEIKTVFARAGQFPPGAAQEIEAFIATLEKEGFITEKR